MSLRELLAQHSQNISANIQHSTEIAQANTDRKANDLEDRFQHVKDTIEGAGGDLAAIGGAYHMGRKIYKKVQQARQAAQSLRGTGTDPTTSDIQIDLPEGSSESGGSVKSKPNVGDAEQTNPEAHTTEDSTPAGESSGDTQPVQPEQAEAPQSGGGGSEGAKTIEDVQQNIGGKGRYQIEEGELGGPTGHPSGDLARNIAGAEEDATGRTVASVADEAGDELASDAVGSVAKAGAQALGRGTSALVVNNADTATQAASKLAGVGGDALSAGLDTASAVLDALGPVGEAAGIVTSLVGLFEGLAHKKKEVEETGQAASTEQSVSAGVDPTALAEDKTQ